MMPLKPILSKQQIAERELFQTFSISRIGLLDADHTFLSGGWELVLFSENLVAAPCWKEISHPA